MKQEKPVVVKLQVGKKADLKKISLKVNGQTLDMESAQTLRGDELQWLCHCGSPVDLRLTAEGQGDLRLQVAYEGHTILSRRLTAEGGKIDYEIKGISLLT